MDAKTAHEIAKRSSAANVITAASAIDLTTQATQLILARVRDVSLVGVMRVAVCLVGFTDSAVLRTVQALQNSGFTVEFFVTESLSTIVDLDWSRT